MALGFYVSEHCGHIDLPGLGRWQDVQFRAIFKTTHKP